MLKVLANVCSWESFPVIFIVTVQGPSVPLAVKKCDVVFTACREEAKGSQKLTCPYHPYHLQPLPLQV